MLRWSSIEANHDITGTVHLRLSIFSARHQIMQNCQARCPAPVAASVQLSLCGWLRSMKRDTAICKSQIPISSIGLLEVRFHLFPCFAPRHIHAICLCCLAAITPWLYRSHGGENHRAVFSAQGFPWARRKNRQCRWQLRQQKRLWISINIWKICGKDICFDHDLNIIWIWCLIFFYVCSMHQTVFGMVFLHLVGNTASFRLSNCDNLDCCATLLHVAHKGKDEPTPHSVHSVHSVHSESWLTVCGFAKDTLCVKTNHTKQGVGDLWTTEWKHNKWNGHGPRVQWCQTVNGVQ